MKYHNYHITNSNAGASRGWTVPGDEQAQQVDMRLVMGWHRLCEIGAFCLNVKWASGDGLHGLHGLPVFLFFYGTRR